jgi:Uncharacterised nucleotidyltransferase
VGEGATTAANDPAGFFRVVREAVSAMEQAAIDHAVIGSAAYVAYVGECAIEDLDILVKPEDARAALDALGRAGFRTQRTDPRWLYKAWRDGVLIDVIFRPPRSFVLDEEMIGRRRSQRIGGVDVWMLAPEDQVLLELASDAEDSPWHWRAALRILAKHEIDWSLLHRPPSDENGLRLLGLLLYARTEGIEVDPRILPIGQQEPTPSQG